MRNSRFFKESPHLGMLKMPNKHTQTGTTVSAFLVEVTFSMTDVR
jgi:hypothetical protein